MVLGAAVAIGESLAVFGVQEEHDDAVPFLQLPFEGGYEGHQISGDVRLPIHFDDVVSELRTVGGRPDDRGVNLRIGDREEPVGEMRGESTCEEDALKFRGDGYLKELGPGGRPLWVRVDAILNLVHEEAFKLPSWRGPQESGVGSGPEL